MLKCCSINCDEDAEFLITDRADGTDSSTTHACEAHVGSLLSHGDGWNGQVQGWAVSSLNPMHG